MSVLSCDELRRDPRWGVLAVCLVALALPLSFSAGAVAVPALAGRFQGAPSALAWVTNAFMLSFGSLLLAAGGLADRFGRRRLFLCGSAGFVLATLAVCLAADLRALDLARGLQGVAAAAALASGSAALAQRFQGHARMRVFALMGTMFGVGLALGPLLAGLLLA
ncbi:MAG TPA: MFS transporter, partial [Stenotrophomonas sp.]|nr:MFS transporter [Stenotrophomonas sp.]